MSKIAALTVASITALGLATTEARAFEIKRTESGRAVRWRVSDVQFVIDPSVDALPGAGDAIARGTWSWTARRGSPTLGVSRDGISRTAKYDGVNTILYAPEGYEAAGRALAITIVTYDDRTGTILDADIVLNGKYKLAPFDAAEVESSLTATEVEAQAQSEHDADTSATYDLSRVVAHELGHALGLSDEPTLDGSLMFPYVQPAKQERSTPAPDDLAGLLSLYASSNGATHSKDASSLAALGCTTSRVASSAMSGGAPHADARGWCGAAVAIFLGFVVRITGKKRYSR
ncbi:hypothetical protein AKJ09_07642 [Labilithrix luteola]|uniref:Peptidase M10 metallopeptidase domain-containing protein n=1 Tax=Labilithrix luteola TaxID=1391654 RepID=A0A0K1Q5I1_9BACT|nr:matrixin family metalloprotease [Labilithrix luteola]AKV00979.1 hypothetical protein AKJ09_07642 [Labilithrix luteola]